MPAWRPTAAAPPAPQAPAPAPPEWATLLAAGGQYVARWWKWLKHVSPDAAHDMRNPAFGGSTSCERGGAALCLAGWLAGGGGAATACYSAQWQPCAAGSGRSSAASLQTCMQPTPPANYPPPACAAIFTVCVNDMVQEDVDLVRGLLFVLCCFASRLAHGAGRGCAVLLRRARGGRACRATRLRSQPRESNRSVLPPALPGGGGVWDQRRPPLLGQLLRAAPPLDGAPRPQAAGLQVQVRRCFFKFGASHS